MRSFIKVAVALLAIAISAPAAIAQETAKSEGMVMVNRATF